MSWLPRKKVVVPIDFSDQSFAVLKLALGMVEKPSDLDALHVLAPLHPSDPGVVWGQVDDNSRMQHAAAAMRERLAETDCANVNVVVVVGDPGHEIADHAERIGAELIALSSHGRTGVKRLLIGSVAERVVRLAHCPVLVIKPAKKK